MEVDFFKENCTGVGERLCMVVHEEGVDGWTFFYDGIEGFEYEWCHLYELEVSRRDVPNPPMDGSSVEYSLVEVVSQTPQFAGEEFYLTIQDWWLTGDEGDYWMSDEFPLVCDTEEMCDTVVAELLDETLESVDVTLECPGDGAPPVIVAVTTDG